MVSELGTGEKGFGLLLKTPCKFDATVSSGKKNPKFGDSGSLAQEIQSGFIDNRLNPQGDLMRTPTTMDVSENALKDAAKLMSGKTKRSSGENVQITLAQQAAMDYLKDKPKLIESLNNEKQIQRINPPSKKEWLEWVKTIPKKEMVDNTGIKKTTIDHWYRSDDSGFTLPTISDWLIVRNCFDVADNIDKKMSEIREFDWQGDLMLTPATVMRVENLDEASQVAYGFMPTPRARDYKGGRKLETIEERRANGNPVPDFSLTTILAEYGKSVQLNPYWVEWYMGFPVGWTDLEAEETETFDISIEPNISRTAKVKKSKDRIKGLGNAIVPQVAIEIFKAIEKEDYD